jgi:hypothetical protein
MSACRNLSNACHRLSVEEALAAVVSVALALARLPLGAEDLLEAIRLR